MHWHEKIKNYGVFRFIIYNYGKAPASNIHIEFKFPDGMRVVDASSLPAEPVEPMPPSLKKIFSDELGSPVSSSRYPFYLDMAKINSSYSVEKNGSTLIVKIDRISHFFEYTSDLVFAHFEDQLFAEQIWIRHRVLCDEMPEIDEYGLCIHPPIYRNY